MRQCFNRAVVIRPLRTVVLHRKVKTRSSKVFRMKHYRKEGLRKRNANIVAMLQLLIALLSVLLDLLFRFV
nr:MAG TPA: hypothetical protein [Caudoviricetes sp.]